MDFTTTRTKVKAFNSTTDRWQREALDWLRDMRSRGFECTESHTLEIRENHREGWFNLFVVEELPGLDMPKPLPPMIFENYEVGTRFGHAILADCRQSPPAINVHRHFWIDPLEGAESHFESLVMPLINKLVSRFSRGDLWAS